MPRVITIYKKCVTYNIPDILIKRLHYNDLLLMILGLDIAEIRHILTVEKKQKLQKQGIKEIKKLSAQEAVNFMKGK